MDKAISAKNLLAVCAISVISFAIGSMALTSLPATMVLLAGLFLLFFSFNNPKKAICVYFFLLPFFPSYLGIDFKLIGTIHGVRLLNISLLLAPAVKYLLDTKKRSAQKKLLFFDILVVSFLILYSLRFFLVFEPSAGIGYLYHIFIDYYLIYFVVTRYVTSREDFVKIANALIISAFFLLVFGLIDYVFSIGVYTDFARKIFPRLVLTEMEAVEMARFSFNRMQISFGQPLSLGIYLCVIHMLIVFNYKKTFRLFKKIAYGATFLLGFLCFILAQARGPLIVDLLLLLVFYVIFFRKMKYFFLPLTLIILVTGVIFGIGLVRTDAAKTQELFYQNINRLENALFRLDLYRETFSNLRHLSLIGEHTFLFRMLNTRLQEDVVIFYLQLLIDNGIFTFSVFMFLIGKILSDMFRLSRANKENYIYGYYFAFIAPLLCFLEISFVGMAIFYFWITLAACVSIITHPESLRNETERVISNNSKL